MKNRVLAVLLSTAMIVTSLTGCGNAATESNVAATSAAATETNSATSESGTSDTTDTAASSTSGAASTVTINDDNRPSDDAKTGGTLRIGTAQNPPVIGFTPEIKNNSLLQYARCAYDSLTTYDEAGNIVGDLAESWDVDADAATVTFHLLTTVTASMSDTAILTPSKCRSATASDTAFPIRILL